MGREPAADARVMISRIQPASRTASNTRRERTERSTRRTQAGRWLWIVGMILGALLLWFGSKKHGVAHIPGREDWNDVLSASKNQYNGECCGLGDAHLVEFDDWRLRTDGA